MHGRLIPRRSLGFTLVEILVVIVIIGIVTVGAMLSMSFLGSDRQMGAEADRLAALINYAEEQANLQTRELGLYCTSSGYRFLTFDARSNLWVPVTGDDALRTRQLPDGLQLKLNVDGQDVVLKDQMPPLPPPGSAPGSYPGSYPAASLPPALLLSSSAPDPQSQLQPQVMIFSNGDLSTFHIQLSRDGSDHVVVVNPDAQGRVSASEPQANAT